MTWVSPPGARAPSLDVAWAALAAALATALAITPAPARGASPAPAAAARSAGDEGPADATPVELPEEVVTLPAVEATRDPTAAVTVVSAERFAGEARQVAALVATAPGVAVQQYGGLGQLSTVQVRGAAASGVLVLLDGLPLNTASGTGVDLSTIPRHWISRIEILRGAEGAYFGSGALGGVVNVVTRDADAGRRWSAELTGGSYETWGGAADGAFTIGRSELFAAASAEGTDGAFRYAYDATPNDPRDPLVERRRANNATARAGLVLKLGRPAGDGRLDALVQLSAGHRELPGSPRALTPDASQEDARVVATGRLSGRGPLGTLSAVRLSVRGDALDLRAAVAGGALRQRGGAAQGEVEVLRSHPGGAIRAGLTLEAERLDTGRDAHARGAAALALSDDLALAGGRLRLAPAARLERIGDETALSAKLGASVRLAGPLALRASAGRSHRVPGFAELYLEQGVVTGNPDLVPERGVGVDAALVLDRGPVVASAGAHATLFDDLVFYQQATGGRLKPFNSQKALVRGVELELATAPAPRLLGLALSGSYTFLATEALRGAPEQVGKEIAHRPRHRLYGRVAAGHGPVSLFAELHVVGRQFEDAPNEKVLPATRVWNAGGALRVSRARALSLHLTVDNLADDRTLQDGFGNPLPARTVLVTVRAGGSHQEGTP